MAKVQSHRELIVWQKAMDLVVEIYRISGSFPAAERYRLVDQLCRAAVSVPANIAEGQGRATSKDFAHFLSVARGSLNETETFVMLAIRLGYSSLADVEHVLEAITEVSKMLGSLRSRIVGRNSG
jgi:four helix bundle protein